MREKKIIFLFLFFFTHVPQRRAAADPRVVHQVPDGRLVGDLAEGQQRVGPVEGPRGGGV